MKILLNKQTDKLIKPSKITKDLLLEAKQFFKFTKTLENCAGLAYNQAGGDKRFCSILTKNKIFMINPEIVIFKGKVRIKKEGCLSFPDKVIIAKRYPIIIVSYYDFAEGKEKTKTYNDYTAQVIQHEVGHLDGHIHYFE